MKNHHLPKTRYYLLTIIWLCLGLSTKALAQIEDHWENTQPKINLSDVLIDQYQIKVSQAHGKLLIDGLLDDQDWQKADSIRQFYQNYPYDTGYAQSPTIVRMMRDNKYLYISAVCYDRTPGKYISPSLTRDWNTRDTDGFQWVIDPYLDKTNGYGFAVSAYNAQREGLISNGGNGGMNTSWDNKWYSAVKQYPDRWVMEAAIPFKSMRYKSDLAHWRINFARTDYKSNEMSVWVPMFRNFSIANLGFTGKAVFEQPVQKAGSNISFIPYGNTKLNQTRIGRSDVINNTIEASAGFDAKVGLGSATNLDLTVNPDFSQVEVDRQVTNLSRFEIFFPERRNFFLENQDLFDSYGNNRIRPFFSRRIGIAYDSSTGLNVNNPILFGARLSGKLGQNWRIGVLATQTANNAKAGNLGQNDVMLSVQRRVFDRSYIGAFLINKQGFGSASGLSFNASPTIYARNAGLEYNLVSRNNRWTGKAFYYLSSNGRFKENKLGETTSSAGGVNLAYNDRKLSVEVNAEVVGQNYTADLGFQPRQNYTYISPEIGYTFLRKSGLIASHGPYLSYETYIMPKIGNEVRVTDQSIDLSYGLSDNQTRSVRLGIGQDFVYLFSPFNPTNSGTNDTLSRNTTYNNSYIRYNLSSDIRKPIYFTLSGIYGGYYVGQKLTLNGNFNYRLMPYVALGLTATFNRLNLPEPWGNKDIWLLGPNVNLSLSNNVFFKLYYQYNTQINNTNINARLQWRYSPASDLFVVYTDNYFISDNMKFKNRGLVIKLTYWLNA